MNGNGKYGGEYKTQTLETVPSQGYGQRPAKGGKLKAHFRRFWWLHLISFIIGTILVTLLLVFVGMPNIAQNGINDAQLVMTSQVVSNPTPSAVHLNMQTISKSKSMFHPMLDEFKAALFLESTEPDIKPFGYITIPRLKATAEATVSVDQQMEIVDQDQFAAYNLLVLKSDTYRVAVRGRTGLKEGGFPKTQVNFNKVITSKGLNSLNGFRVQNINITLVPEADGTNMRGEVYIPNPSPMTISMGLVTQNIFVAGKQIGVTTIPDLTLRPGDNIVPMKTASDQATVIGLISTKYKDGMLPIDIVGNSSIFNGQHLPYFEKALQANKMSTTLNLGPALKGIGIDVSLLGGSTTASPSIASKPKATTV